MRVYSDFTKKYKQNTRFEQHIPSGLKLQELIDVCVYELRSTHFEKGLLLSPKIISFCAQFWNSKTSVISPNSIYEWMSLSLLSNIKSAPRRKLVNDLLRLGFLSSPMSRDKTFEWGFYTCNLDSYADCGLDSLYDLKKLYYLFDEVFDESFGLQLKKMLKVQTMGKVKDVCVGTVLTQSAFHFEPFVMDASSPVRLVKNTLYDEHIYNVTPSNHKLFTLRCEGAVDEEHTTYFEINIPVTFYFETPIGLYGQTLFVHVLRIGVRSSKNKYFKQNTAVKKRMFIPELNMSLPIYDSLVMAAIVAAESPIAGVLLVYAMLENKNHITQVFKIVNDSKHKRLIMKVMSLTMKAIKISNSVQHMKVSFISPASIEH